MSASRLALILTLAASAAIVACESKRISLVAETDDEGADFGRTALSNAIVALSEKPRDPGAYRILAQRIEEIRPLFNRQVEKEAELRLSVLAVAPLKSGLMAPFPEQMQRFATTVWPSVLRFPTEQGEDVDAYVLRLCTTELALTCNNVVPEYWPVILNARVWRMLKSQVDVAYDRCQWCEDDPSFPDIMDNIRQAHLRLEQEAHDGQDKGQPSSWPMAGANASDLGTELIVAFGTDGLVRVSGEKVPDGDWRATIATARAKEELLGVHIRPERMVSELLEFLADAKQAGFSRVALVARNRRFPYQAKQYELRSQTTSFRDLRVQRSDSVQVLVQALDRRAGKASGLPQN